MGVATAIRDRAVPAEAWKRNQYAILVSVFISWLAFSFVTPFLPLFIRQLGVTDVRDIAFYSGLSFAVSPLLSGLLAPFWGRLADRYGVKIMVQRALVSFGIVYVLMAFITHPWQLIALRLSVGIFGGFGPMTAALVTIGVPREHVGQSIGRLQATQIFANAIGPLLGGVLADTLGIRASFLVTAGLNVLAMAMITALYREQRGRAAGHRRGARLSLRAILVLPGFLTLMAIMLIGQCVDRGFSPVLPLFISELDPTRPVASTAGFVFSVGLFVSAAAASQIGRLMERVPPSRLLIGSLACGLVATAPLILISQIWHLLALRVVFGLATGTTATLTYAAATRLVPQESRTTAFGFLGSATNLATAAGPLAAGALAGFSLRAVFVADTILYVGALALAGISASRPVPSPEDEPAALATATEAPPATGAATAPRPAD